MAKTGFQDWEFLQPVLDRIGAGNVCELAERIGCGHGTLREVVARKKGMSLAALCRLCRALEIELRAVGAPEPKRGRRARRLGGAAGESATERRLRSRLAKGVRALRARRGLSVQDLAELLGCGRSAVAEIEQGRLLPGAVLLVGLAKLGLDVGEL